MRLACGGTLTSRPANLPPRVQEALAAQKAAGGEAPDIPPDNMDRDMLLDVLLQLGRTDAGHA